MVFITQSLSHFLYENYPQILPLVMLGKLELLTKKIQDQYIDWCKTDDGKQYLKGGSKYDNEWMEKYIRGH